MFFIYSCIWFARVLRKGFASVFVRDTGLYFSSCGVFDFGIWMIFASQVGKCSFSIFLDKMLLSDTFYVSQKPLFLGKLNPVSSYGLTFVLPSLKMPFKYFFKKYF